MRNCPCVFYKVMYLDLNINQITVQTLFNIALRFDLSYDVVSGREITPCIKIDKPLVQIFKKHYEMTLLTSRIWQNPKVFMPKI